MILEEETFNEFGYRSKNLKPKSNKLILVACDKCGKRRTTKKSDYRNFCPSCSRKGNPFSEHHKRAITESLKGHYVSEETKEKISKGNKGHTHTDETKQKMSKSHEGKKLSDETKQKLKKAKENISEEIRLKLRNGKIGEKNHRYIDGRKDKEFKELYGVSYSEWEKIATEIRKRDKYICKICGNSQAMDVHHIIPRRIKIDMRLRK